VLARVEPGAALAHEDRARAHLGAVEHLHAEALGVRVAAVLGGAGALRLGHVVAPPSALADAGDLDGGVPLAVPPAPPLVGLRLVGEAGDLRALRLAHDPGGDLGALQRLGAGQHGVAVDEEDGRELDLLGLAHAQQLDVEPLAVLDPVLLATGLDDCVHALCLVRRARARARTTTGTGQPTRPPPAVANLPAQSGSSSLSMSTPRPSQVGHRVVNDSSRPSPIRLRVISHRPSSEISNTCVRVLSRDRASRKTRMTSSRLEAFSMSMKSTTMMPPTSRSRSWRAISSAASRLFLNTVSSRLEVPTFLPVLTSMTVSASVCSMMSDPPEGSHTLRSSARCSCSCTWWRS